MRRRLLVPVALAAVLAGLSPGIAIAKFPPFTVEVEPERPVAGQPVTVVLRTWEDTAHTKVADWGIPSPMEDLLALFWEADADARGVWTDIVLEETAAGQWSVTLAPLETGTWVLRAFPDRRSTEPMPAGYPDEVRFTVAPADSGLGPVVAAGAGSIGLLLAVVTIHRRRRQM